MLDSFGKFCRTTPTGEEATELRTVNCDYRLSYPQLSDEAIMLYTALTRSRNQLYFIEAEEYDFDDVTFKRLKTVKKCDRGNLAGYAFWRFTYLSLADAVNCINEGQVEMTPAQHKARGVEFVTQALNMMADHEPFPNVRRKLEEAIVRFGPSMGNDNTLLTQCKKHLKALELKQDIKQYARKHFFICGKRGYCMKGLFAEVIHFEELLSSFFSACLGDSFLLEVVTEIRCLVQDVFVGTPYETRFDGVCNTIMELESLV